MRKKGSSLIGTIQLYYYKKYKVNVDVIIRSNLYVLYADIKKITYSYSDR